MIWRKHDNIKKEKKQRGMRRIHAYKAIIKVY